MVDDLDEVFELNPRNGIVIKEYDAKIIGDGELRRLGEFLYQIRDESFTAIDLPNVWVT